MLTQAVSSVTHLKPIWGVDKESYYLPLQNHRKSCCAAVLFRVKNVTMSTNRTSFLKEWYSTITLSISTVPVLLTVFWIDDIITAQKNSFDADTLDGCLHFVCNLITGWNGHKASGDLNNQNLERRPAIAQHPIRTSTFVP